MNYKDFNIVDERNKKLSPNYFKSVFFREDRIRSEIGRCKWMWLCLLETLFGAELLENLVTTASAGKHDPVKDPNMEFGLAQQLSMHIPSGIFTNLFHHQIIQLLYYKFHLQYLILSRDGIPIPDPQKREIDVKRVRFALQKRLLYQFIAFRRVYIVTAIAASLILNIIAYYVTESAYIAAYTAIGLEALRRIFKI
ncbi:hypothetical protein [Comamonas sp. MYb69]|uniref:hypothetical protein n=1 Tax=Comamonas sp. MYb69 TaxID=1848650 RepID=UPI003095CAF2